jgi:hypothetical protein
MDTIYLKISISEMDIITERLRDEGLFFVSIAEALDLNREQIVEIEPSNYEEEIRLMRQIFFNK